MRPLPRQRARTPAPAVARGSMRACLPACLPCCVVAVGPRSRVSQARATAMAAAAVRGAARALPSLALAYADGHVEVRWLKCAAAPHCVQHIECA